MAQLRWRMTCCCRDCCCCFWTAPRKNSNVVGLWAGGYFNIIPHPSHQRNTLMHPFPFVGYPFTPHHDARKSVVQKFCIVNCTALYPLPSPLKKEIVYQECVGLQHSYIGISLGLLWWVFSFDESLAFWIFYMLVIACRGSQWRGKGVWGLFIRFKYFFFYTPKNYYLSKKIHSLYSLICKTRLYFLKRLSLSHGRKKQ